MKKKYIFALICIFSITGISFSQTTYYWRAEATNGNWNVASNWWNGAAALPPGSEILQFENNNQTTMTNDLPSTNRYRIFFKVGATTSRTIGGATENTFYDFGGNVPKIENNSSSLHTINFPIKIGYTTMFISPVVGDLTFGGTVNLQNNTLEDWGNFGHILTFNGVVSGTGNIIIKQNSKMIFNAVNTYTGYTLVEHGNLEVNADMASGIEVKNDGNLIVNTDLSIPYLTLNNTATATIKAGKSLTISGNFTNNSSNAIILEDGASLIITGIAVGNITHNLNVPDTNWHLVSAPVSGVTINDAWVAANSLASGTGTNMGAADYDNSTDANGSWAYFQAGNSFSLNSGGGVSIKRSAAGNVAFTGTYTTAPVNLTTTQSSGAVGNDWNLLGNPFTSYIDIAAFITANTANFSGAYQSIYVWDNSAGGGTGAYVSKTTGYLQPGQGFFVNSDAGTSVTFTSAMQSHQSGITFYRTNPTDFAINLRMSDGTNLKSTEIVYENGKTTGLDPRFDIGSFTGENTSFNLYTELITNNSGVDFMRQSLPTSDYENMVIPVGINATAGTQLTFTADVVNIPSGHMVFLEDRANNTFTRIDESNSNYQVTLNSDSNGIGRFYIHASTQRLKVDNVALQNISVYTKNNHLIMAGLPQGNTSVSLYNILGKNILTTSFNSNGFKELTLPSLSKGVYIVQLATEKGNLNKKVIIE